MQGGIPLNETELSIARGDQNSIASALGVLKLEFCNKDKLSVLTLIDVFRREDLKECGASNDEVSGTRRCEWDGESVGNA